MNSSKETRDISLYDNVFSNIDTDRKEYFLGLVNTGIINQTHNYIDIHVNKDNLYILKRFNDELFGKMLKIKPSTRGFFVRIYSQRLIDDILRIDLNEIKSLSYLRGIYENCGWTHNNKTRLVSPKKELLVDFFVKLKKNADLLGHDTFFQKTSTLYTVLLKDDRALDFLYILYSNMDLKNDLYNSARYKEYRAMCSYIPLDENLKNFNYKLQHPDAVPPFKSRPSDSGYDLTLIKKIKTNGNVEFYDTGVILEPPLGYYFDLVGRSSISKSGYILANSVGIIDRSYRGTVIVPLIKIDNSKEDLQLPNRLVQIIPRLIQHLNPTEIFDVSDTDRGIDGFGTSTGQ